MNGRRAFLGFIGKAAAAAPALPHVVSELAAEQVGFGVGKSRDGVVTPQASSWTHKLSKEAFKKLLRSRERKTDLIRLTALHRLDGCDPDIHCLRSLSPGARQRMQLRRDLANRSELARMSNELWPEVMW